MSFKKLSDGSLMFFYINRFLLIFLLEDSALQAD